MTTANQDDTQVMPDEYKNAFDEVAGASTTVSDDDAMGISTPGEEAAVAAEEAGESTPQEVAEGESQANDGTKAEQNVATETATTEAVADAEDEDDEAGMTPKELQRKRSWEGRLRKMEADLKVVADQNKAKPVEETLAAAVVSAETGADADQQQAAEELVEGLQDGSITADAAMKQLTEDFGEEFVKMVSAVVAKAATDIAGKTVADKVKQVSDEVKQITSHIADADERRHFETIAAAVPDFFEQVKAPAFAAFVEAADADTKRIASQGSAKEVIAMMKKFEAASKPAVAKPVVKEDPALAAAEGVRSGAMRLPDQPSKTGNDDFEGAWAEAAKQA